MFTLVIGGSASGKSEYAEEQVMALPGRRWYIATMKPWDDECLERIAKHQTARAQREFTTVECYRNLPALDLPPGGNILLECMGNLLANELYGSDAGGAERVLAGIDRLLETCSHLTVVTNEVFSSGAEYTGDTLRYLKELARVNCMLARKADRVVELLCGLPNVLKEAP